MVKELHLYYNEGFGTPRRWVHSMVCWCDKGAEDSHDIRVPMGTVSSYPYRWFRTDGERYIFPEKPKPTTKDFNDGIDAAWGVLSHDDKAKYGKKLTELVVV